PTIKPISSTAIQQIVAGQAITDLSSAVKELVDNAIDAKATRVCVKLYNQGLESIQVSDNGTGVPKSSRPLMAMKHATSKLREFDDLYTAPTLGFRGEALFCLANVSRSLTVSTRSSDDDTNTITSSSNGLGEQFAFNHEGGLISTSVQRVPRGMGTTVVVEGLFETLPVRRVDLCKRIKGQRMKLLRVLQGYAILCLGTQFNLTDVNAPNSKSKCKSDVRLATSESSNTLEQRTASVLGTKFLSGLTRIEINLHSATRWKMEGLVSHAPTSPHSATARDLQFFSINGRPVDLPTVSRVLGDVWRLGSGGRRRPACVLAFTLPNNMYDVNLSPDKREVLFTEEASISELIREGLTKLWSGESEGKFEANAVESRSNTMKGKVASDAGATATYASVGIRSESVKSTGKSKDETETCNTITPCSRRKKDGGADDRTAKPSQADDGAVITPTQGNDPMQHTCNKTAAEANELDSDEEDEQDATTNAATIIARRSTSTLNESSSIQKDNTPMPPDRQMRLNFNRVEKRQTQKELQRVLNDATEDDQPLSSIRRGPELMGRARESVSTEPSAASWRSKTKSTKRGQDVGSFLDNFSFDSSKLASNDEENEDSPEPSKEEGKEEPTYQHAAESHVGSMSRRIVVGKRILSQKRSLPRNIAEDAGDIPPAIRTQSARRASSSSVSAEQNERQQKTNREPQRAQDSDSTVNLSKEDFLRMSIIGQFNLGFILARTPDHNLFILDQHACDEKYNFERLFKETVIHEQKLIAPLPLELSPSEEHCVLDHMEVFERNGFRFSYDPDKEPRHRLSLTALPHSGSVQFGKEDVGALCAMLGADGTYAGMAGSQEGSIKSVDGILGSSIAIAMFASRACRGSIMIGTALSHKEQMNILKKLDKTDIPWNCAHGRPTMSHIRNLKTCLLEDDDTI
ncbi:hypothetical protein THAPSDRAFT_264783, partial [Thalassiosira pseudonana CCMP1335]